LLPPSTYIINTRRDGFSPVEVRDVVLNVGDQKALQIQLRAGDVNAQVTVDSDAEAIRTDGSVGTVVDRRLVANMPLNGRTVQSLIQLTPGVVLTQALSSAQDGAIRFSVNGQRTTSNYFMVDGVSADAGISAGGPGAAGSGQVAATTVLGGTNSLASIDAIQEFRVETSTYAAEYGRTPGAQISLVTRSGTNQIHGSASYFLRNEALDANDWFANSNKQPKPKERQNLFGGVLGGPIKKNRIFFFGSYEGLRLKQPQVSVQMVTTAGVRAQAVPALRPYLKASPLPNGQDFGNGTAQFTASYSNPGRFNVLAVRVDGRVSDTLSTFIRVSHAPSESETRVNSLSTITRTRSDNDAYTAGATWLLSPHLSVEFRGNWTRVQSTQSDRLDTFGGAVIPSVSDIFAPGRDPSKSRVDFFGPNSVFGWGLGGRNLQRQLNFVNTNSWSVGSHQLKFGFDYRRTAPLIGLDSSGSFEAFFFNDSKDLLATQIPEYQIAIGDPLARRPVFPNLSVFGQDTWRISRRLTMTYGLRFERVTPPGTVYGSSGRTPPVILGIEGDTPRMLRLATAGTPLWYRRFGYFAPRIGGAYRLSTHQRYEATLRGGAGVYYDLGLGFIANAFASGVWPFQGIRDEQGLALANLDRTSPPLAAAPSQIRAMDPNLRLPYTIQWNATLEQGLGSDQSITIGYVGANGRRLLLTQGFLSQSVSDFAGQDINLLIQRGLGRSVYHGLQVQYQRRLRHGFQALASYTLATARDNVSQDNIQSGGPQTAINGLAMEWASSDFDVRNVLAGALSLDLPGYEGGPVLSALSKGWGLDALVRIQSAFPVTVYNSNFIFPPDGTFFRFRPNLVSGQPLYVYDSSLPGGRRFNRAAFVSPPAGQQGDFPRNGLRGFPASQVDLALRREFKLGEVVKLQLRGEFFNIFNHPNFGFPQTSLNNARFGQPSQMLNRSLGGLNGLYQMGGPRSGQLSVRFIW
jgi:hypothetical protein